MQAQLAHDGQLQVNVERMAQQGDRLNVVMQLQLTQALSSGKTLDVTPVITDGFHRVSMHTLTFMGKSKMREYRRYMALNGTANPKADDPEQVEPGFEPLNKRVAYHASVPYEEWMDGAHMELQSELCNCGGSAGKRTLDLMAANVETAGMMQVAPDLALAYVRPEVEQQKRRAASGEALLQFEVNRWDIKPLLADNTTELARIHQLIESVQTADGVNVRNINIKGFASPEGSVKGNQLLSENRARSMADYLAQRYNLSKGIFNAQFGGEDWQGLADAISDDETLAASKDALLKLIANEQNVEARKQALAKMGGGETYRYLLREIYPQLRRVLVHIDYDVKNFSLEEAKRVFYHRPQNLSLNEMYQVANAYGEGSQEFIDVFETAVRLFPEDATANLNAAVAALHQRNESRAEQYLKEVEKTPLAQTPEYFNALGGLQLLRGNYEEARQCFAKAGDLPQAQANMETINQLTR